MKIVYLFINAMMNLITSVVVLYTIYRTGYTGQIKWFIILGTIIFWVFYPIYEYTKEQFKEGGKKLKCQERLTRKVTN